MKYKSMFKTKEYQKAKQLLLTLNQNIKNLVSLDWAKTHFNKAGHIGTGVGFIDGKPVERVIIILRGCGCGWSQQAQGGCIMCGHYSASSKGRYIPSESLEKQFDGAMAEFDFRKYPMLCLYNGGSFLNESEIAAESRRYMLKKIASIPHIRRLIIESRPEYISSETLDEIERLLPHTTVEIGVGVETARDDIRELILNKGVTTRDLVEVGKKFRGRKTQLLAYVLLNPPFLNETEAIEDAISTIEFSLEIGAALVSIEAVSIQHLTVVSFLYEAGYYSPPWIWSIFEIVKRTAHLGITTRIGGFEFFPIPKEFTSNCSTCNEEMINRINEFNRTNDLKVIENLKCSSRCDIKWQKELKKTDRRSLPERVIESLESIEISKILKSLQERKSN